MPTADTGVVILDASVAVRWLVEEEGSDEAIALLDEASAWLAPRLMLTEVASALRRKVEDDDLDILTATQVLDAILTAVDAGMIRLADDERLVGHALDIALSTRHKFPDCMYLALAEDAGGSLATADRKLARLAASRGIRVRQVPHG